MALEGRLERCQHPVHGKRDDTALHHHRDSLSVATRIPRVRYWVSLQRSGNRMRCPASRFLLRRFIPPRPSAGTAAHPSFWRCAQRGQRGRTPHADTAETIVTCQFFVYPAPTESAPSICTGAPRLGILSLFGVLLRPPLQMTSAATSRGPRHPHRAGINYRHPRLPTES